MPFNWEKVSRNDEVYKNCLVVSNAGGAIVGAAVGGMAGGVGSVPGFFAGTAWGFAFGYAFCPYLAPLIKKKFLEGTTLTENELSNAAEAMSLYANVGTASEALKLIAISRPYLVMQESPPSKCEGPESDARYLLRLLNT